jgi:hypothetical protein
MLSTHLSFHASLIKLTLSFTWEIMTARSFFPLPCCQSTFRFFLKWAIHSRSMIRAIIFRHHFIV